MRRFTFLVLGLMSVAGAGCIGIPLPERPLTPNSLPVRSLVGEAGSDKPFRVGVTRRDQVLVELGPARWCTQNDLAMGYQYDVNATQWFGLNVVDHKAIFPLIPRYTPAKYFLFLGFDEPGVLRRHALHRKYGFVDDRADDEWTEFVKDIPDKEMDDQCPYNLSSTAPTTRPRSPSARAPDTGPEKVPGKRTGLMDGQSVPPARPLGVGPLARFRNT